MAHPRPRCRHALSGLILLAVAAGAVAAEPPPESRWTADDAVLGESVRTADLAGDGSLVAWVEREVAKVEGEERVVDHLWACALPDGEARQLSFAVERIGGIAVSPDGRHLAFTSDRKPPADREAPPEGAATQLWALPLAGGEAFPVGRFDRSVRAFGWRDDATLVVAAQESPSAWELERKERKDTTQVVDDAAHEPPVRLFTVSLAGEVKRLTTNRFWIDNLAVAPDGRHALVTEQRSLSYQFDQKTPPHTYLVDLASGAMQRLFPDGVVLPGAIVWAPDGAGVYVTNEHTRHPRYRMATITELYRYDLASGLTAKVDLDWPRGLAGAVAATGDGVIALLADGVRRRPARLVRDGDGWRRQDLDGRHVRNLDGFFLARDGRTLFYRTSSATVPPQWYAARLEGARISGERQLTRLNPRYDGKPTGKVEIVHFTGALGDEVEAVLHYPLDYREGERRPLILDVHGGPTGTDRDTWDFRYTGPNLLWRQRGAFVLQVNYHGSGGYGLDWVESIEQRYYELEIPDLEAGVDYLIERGLVDPQRLASIGWSNGGILTAELITRNPRYKVASVGAADVEWVSDWANVDFGAAFDNYYFGGPPWERLEHYIEKSPFFRLTQVETPTIVHTGTADRNVPPHQSWELFRALQQIGKVETKLLLYPGEPHGLQKIAHQRRKLEEDLAFFDRHLFADYRAPNEALRDGSPLAHLLARSRAARFGVTYGVEHDGKPVPETVRFQGLEVGRFEVTRAQLAASGGPAPAPGSENLPASGLSFEQARAYVAWLSAATGRPYRLPTVAEAESLAEAAGSGGNTLDRWAGYAVNPEDAARLLAAAAELDGDAPLLLPAGSLAPAGDDPVFDLDGNVAEWAVAGDGTGVAVGPSADRPADRRGSAPPSPAYVGLRVVLDR
ncbi:MAG: peptidase S9 [Acidobacteria bacterium]|nr:MAG: peptidase S9 [Acidobacteriota bacterium]